MFQVIVKHLVDNMEEMKYGRPDLRLDIALGKFKSIVKSSYRMEWYPKGLCIMKFKVNKDPSYTKTHIPGVADRAKGCKGTYLKRADEKED